MSESQEDYMEDILKYEVDNALEYEEFEYDKNQWDNIPSIIPKFVLFMSKHLEALVGKCNERFSQISPLELQNEVDLKIGNLEEKLKALEKKFENTNQESLRERNQIKSKLDKFEKEYEENKVKFPFI